MTTDREPPGEPPFLDRLPEAERRAHRRKVLRTLLLIVPVVVLVGLLARTCDAQVEQRPTSPPTAPVR